ncbi:hypothetical protein Anapl_03918 [Anas platyrhynchos]|uniref:Uncharacterized protein n=1 Tax=Anas platyrhynchos TaxID=8839 RepID=R0K4X1_ANAPL|nr:hypothetical protein Anapl_03918 [Anas platyrhynchos]
MATSVLLASFGLTHRCNWFLPRWRNADAQPAAGSGLRLPKLSSELSPEDFLHMAVGQVSSGKSFKEGVLRIEYEQNTACDKADTCTSSSLKKTGYFKGTVKTEAFLDVRRDDVQEITSPLRCRPCSERVCKSLPRLRVPAALLRAAVVSIMDSVEELHILFISVFGHRQLLAARISDPAKPLKAQCLGAGSSRAHGQQGSVSTVPAVTQKPRVCVQKSAGHLCSVSSQEEERQHPPVRRCARPRHWLLQVAHTPRVLIVAMVVRSFQNPSCRGRRHGYNHQKLSAATEAPFAEGFRKEWHFTSLSSDRRSAVGTGLSSDRRSASGQRWPQNCPVPLEHGKELHCRHANPYYKWLKCTDFCKAIENLKCLVFINTLCCFAGIGWELGAAWCFWGAAGSRMDAVLRAPPRHAANASYSQGRFIYPVHKDLIDSSLESTRTLSHSEGSKEELSKSLQWNWHIGSKATKTGYACKLFQRVKKWLGMSMRSK